MRIFGWILSSLAFLAVLAGLGLYGAFVYYARDLPDTAQLADHEPRVTTRLYADDGRMLAEYAVENRLFVPVEAMPEHVRQAFISAEDQHFYDHSGIDFIGVVRAAITNLRNVGSDRRLVGASTITQQVAKNFLLTNEVSFERKIREAILSMRIERAFDKDEILELYLNEIYLGRNSYGVAAAALNYFNKSLPELTLAEAAYLAALPKAPNNYHPTLRREQAIDRRNYVLQRMLEDGAITAEELIEASAQPLEVFERDATEVVQADYFAEEVRRELQRLYGDEMLYGGGLTVRTTVDPRLQEIADRVLRDGLIDYDRRHGWRGPVSRLESFDGWPTQMEALEVPAGAGAWQLAVVLEIYGDAVRVGFADRQQGMVPFDEMQWARPWREGQRVGAAPESVDDVVALGDVVLVEAVEGYETPPAAGPGAPVDDAGNLQPLQLYSLRQMPEIQGALVAMDPHTGRVLAMSGGFSFEISEFNRATQALRQPGSSIKPFVYLAALELDRYPAITPATLILDTPLAVDLGPGAGWWRPDNYGHDFLGPQPLRVGVERSRNIMTVRLLLEIGLEPVQQLTRTFGVYEEMELHYSMALGAGETTPMAMTNGYAMIVNGGRRVRPVFIDRIQDRHGSTIYPIDHNACDGCQAVPWRTQDAPVIPDMREQVADPAATYQMVSILEGVVQRGTAARLASLGLPLAGKTGTTNDARDAWFVGFSPDLVVGTYIGFDTPRGLGPGETGGRSAAPIFGAFMAEALEGQDVPPFRIPPDVSLVRINPRTGAPAAPGEAAILEAFRPGTEPTTTSMLLTDPEREEALIESTLSPTTGTGGLY